MKILHMTLLSAALFLDLARASAASYSVVRSFGVLTNATGFQPQSALVQDGAGVLYGTTSQNEGNVMGAVFKINPDGIGFEVLTTFSTPVHFTNGNGANPVGGLVLSGSTLYGTTAAGGTGGSGNIFKINTDGTGFSVLTNFPSARPNLTNSIGAHPSGGLILSGGTLYGTTHDGGAGQNGAVFSINTSGSGLSVLKTFSPTPVNVNSDGANPDGTLVLSGGILYGTTVKGGSHGYGTVFALNTTTLNFTVLHPFTGGNDSYPHAGLTLSDGWLFGTASGDPNTGSTGTVFMVNTSGTVFNLVYTFTGGNDGATPYGGVFLSGNTLYGTAYGGGPFQAGGTTGFGTVYAVNTNGSSFTNLYDFDGDGSGANPQAGLILSGGTLYGTTGGVTGQEDAAGGNGTVFAVNTNGVGFTNIYTFAYSDAAQPYGGLIIANNTLYGTTLAGGDAGNGAVFQINPDGTGYSVIKSFSALSYNPSGLDFSDSTNSDGANPQAGLALSGGTLYGTTYYGGNYGFGTVFSVNTNGTGFSNLYSFTGGTDGADPQGGMALSGNMLYGTTSGGGSNNNGVVFAIGTDGTGFTLLRTFSATTSGTNSDGANPLAGLIMSGNILYGTTIAGGSHADGTVYSINAGTKSFANLHNFTGGSDGANPYAALVLSDGWLYGTTYSGGANNNGTVFMVTTNGSTFAAIKNFSATTGGTNSDGANPYGGLALFGNMLYGTTVNGGGNGFGTAFAVNTNGAGASFTNLYTFASSNGANPSASLLFSGNSLYGTTTDGGDVGDGTVFALTLFPPPIPLNIELAGNNVILTWTNAAFSLLSAPVVGGVYTNVPGTTSPYTNAITGTQQYFLLKDSQ